ncbi:stage III sporulation protein AG [Ornithinibacillus sp. BX22]|uniref:Stage III sporulation protein AG n=2 Tax=Ornithinibacillus TaxID=484508 RepID=A0A923RIF6_9BACI|nr:MULTISPECIES: stage III sporulation protein AG [Ornithinibacillus]MBC5637174.1 stage III sporulation protein AG [Ornithinibacillus hominis]MBS3679615.1 stage III sporulation protein AG [Ornithinibacillus massiliensis]
MINKLQEFLKDKLNGSKKTGYVILIGLVALLVILMGNIFSSSSQKDLGQDMPRLELESESQSEEVSSHESGTTSDVSVLEANYQKQLKGMLEKIDGVSEVEVMVNLDSTDVKVYEKNLIKGTQQTEENDRNGGTRNIDELTEETQTVIVRQGDQETPVLVQTKKPKVRGVLVVAKGVESATVKQWVVEAISRVLDVPTHKVSVNPKN